MVFQGNLIFRLNEEPPHPPPRLSLGTLYGEMKLYKAEVEEGNWKVKLTLNRNETDKSQLQGSKWRHEANENKPPPWEKLVKPWKFFQFG